MLWQLLESTSSVCFHILEYYGLFSWNYAERPESGELEYTIQGQRGDVSFPPLCWGVASTNEDSRAVLRDVFSFYNILFILWTFWGVCGYQETTCEIHLSPSIIWVLGIGSRCHPAGFVKAKATHPSFMAQNDGSALLSLRPLLYETEAFLLIQNSSGW